MSTEITAQQGRYRPASIVVLLSLLGAPLWFSGCFGQWLGKTDDPLDLSRSLASFVRDDMPTSDSSSATPASPSQESGDEEEPLAVFQLLAKEGYSRKAGFGNRQPDQLGETPYSVARWTYPGLEDSANADAISSAKLRDGNAIVRANTAIFLAHRSDAFGFETLLKTIDNESLRDSTRCAAAHALGLIEHPRAIEEIRNRVDEHLPRIDEGTRQANPTDEDGNAIFDENGKKVAYLAEGGREMPEILAELLYALSRHVPVVSDPRFAQAAASPLKNRLVQRAVAETWCEYTLSRLKRGPLPSDDASSLPAAVIAMRFSPDQQTRICAMRLVGWWNPQNSLHILQQGTMDTSPQVQEAAHAALGAIGSEAALSMLKAAMGKQGELYRTHGVVGYAIAGCEDEVLKAAEDGSWRVRMEVAESLRLFDSPEARSIAARLLEDPCPQVQVAAVESIAQWPFEKSAPMLFDAMHSASAKTRIVATTRLGEHWPGTIPGKNPGEERHLVREFPAQGLAEERRLAMEELEPLFMAQVGHGGAFDMAEAALLAQGADGQPTPEMLARVQQQLERLQSIDTVDQADAAAALAEMGPSLTHALEHLFFNERRPLPEAVYTTVLPKTDPLFDIVDRLTMTDVSLRRKASRELVDWSRTKRFSRLALHRISILCLHETDSLIWTYYLAAIRYDARPEALSIAYTALESTSDDLKCRACEYLESCPDTAHEPYLAAVLEDRTAPVVRAAVRAMGAMPEIQDRRPLQGLLTSTNDGIRAETAIVLALHGDAEAKRLLPALAYCPDEHIQKRVAEVMGRLGDPQYTATLIRLLDGRDFVRRAALESLPLVVGHDWGEPPVGVQSTTTRRIDQWKTWYARSGASTAVDG